MISLHYSNYKSFLDLHVESVIEYCNKPSTRTFKTNRLDALVARYFGTIVSDFESLLKANPATLQRIKNEFDHNIPVADWDDIRDEFSVIGLYKYFTDDVLINTRLGISYGSRYLADKLDVFTCPYCNENFIYYFKYGGTSTIRRTFDWDHIYSQKDYPFLAISFFNLVPCCKVCNQIKLDQNLEYFNPHIDIDINSIYTYNLNPTSAGFITDSSKIQLMIIYANRRFKSEILVTANTVGLLSRMQCHKEIIKDILNKKRMYPNPYLQSVAGTVSQLNANITADNLKKTLYGTHFNHQDYFRRPFSKLTDDILRNSTL